MSHSGKQILEEIHLEYCQYLENHSKCSYKIEHTIEMIIDGYGRDFSNYSEYQPIEVGSDEIGEAAYALFKWKGKYYKLPFSYKSHYGSDYYGDGSDIFEVVPVEKLITVYEYKRETKE